MEQVELKVYMREKISKNENKRIRKAGLIPAVLYGKNLASIPIKIPFKEFQRTISTEAGENVLINLKIEGKENYTVIVKEIQRDTLKDSFLHIDMQQISLEEVMQVKVPLSIIGEPKGVKEGGILGQVIRELEVECLPTQIPSHIDVDVSSLEIGDVIRVSDLIIPEGVKLITHSEEVVVTIVPPEAEEVVEKVEEVPAEPEVIKEKRPEEEEEKE